MKDFIMFLYLLAKLKRRYKFSFTFRKLRSSGKYATGSFEASYDSVDRAGNLVNYKTKVYVSFFEPNKCGTLLHEVGHIVFHERYLKKHRTFYRVCSLTDEREASKFALRVLQLYNNDIKSHKRYLEQCYNTYIRHIHKDNPLQMADESAKVLRRFNMKY